MEGRAQEIQDFLCNEGNEQGQDSQQEVRRFCHERAQAAFSAKTSVSMTIVI